ncbi:MAG: hypothetical protein IJY69_04700 [Clostridia bacterium]|nr:hypothetical protein [Clostridia bacterium]
MKRENCLLIIAGPSAVGKTTVAYELIKIDPRFEFVRSVTTRQRRGDSFDAEYIYITISEFRELIANGGVLEHTEYAGNFYGTPRAEVERIISEGKIPLLVLDINGVGSLVRNAGDLSPCGVYVYDDLEVIRERLRLRFLGDNPTPEGQKKYESRISQNESDYLTIPDTAPRFHAFIANTGSVRNTAEAVNAVYRDFTLGAERDSVNIERIAKHLSASVSK